MESQSLTAEVWVTVKMQFFILLEVTSCDGNNNGLLSFQILLPTLTRKFFILI